MDYLPPDALRNMWEPEDDNVRRRDKFEPYIGRNPFMTFENSDEKGVMQWVKSYLRNRFGHDPVRVVDDKISWIFYDENDTVIARLEKDLVDRMMTMAKQREVPVFPDDRLIDDPYEVDEVT